METIDDLKKAKKGSDINLKVTSEPEEIKLTPLQEFEQSISVEDQKIFDKIKVVLIDKIELYEHEAFSEENLKDIPDLIELFKRDLLEFNDNGVSLTLRRDLVLDSKQNVSAKKLNFLFSRNKARERMYTNRMKLGKDDMGSRTDFNRAMIAASIENIGTIPIAWTKLEKIHDKDYEILLILYGFFR